MQGQQEVICHLKARRILGPKLPHTVQEEQEDWSLWRKGSRNETDEGKTESVWFYSTRIAAHVESFPVKLSRVF